MTESTEVLDFMTPGEVADTLRVTRRLVDMWRQQGRGPNFFRFEGTIRYLRSDVEEYIGWCARQPGKTGPVRVVDDAAMAPYVHEKVAR